MTKKLECRLTKDPVVFGEVLDRMRELGDKEMTLFGHFRHLNVSTKGENGKVGEKSHDFVFYLSETPMDYSKKVEAPFFAIPHIPCEMANGNVEGYLFMQKKRFPHLNYFFVGDKQKEPILAEMVYFRSAGKSVVLEKGYLFTEGNAFSPEQLEELRENNRLKAIKLRQLYAVS